MPVYSNRRVKIVTTLGPAVAGPERLRELILAGADMVRINAAHGTPESRARLIDDVRAVADELGNKVPVLFDLRGLKIRTGPLKGEDPVGFARGTEVVVVPRPEPTEEGRIGIDYEDLLAVIRTGSRILISDGLIELLVERIEGQQARCTVGRGGLLLSRQGVTLPEAPIEGGALTKDDLDDVAFAIQHGVDFLGLSFIHSAGDLLMARGVAEAHSRRPPALIAKIERPDALENVRDIAQQADAVMVARGDLGVQLPPERVPLAQKEIIGVANSLGVPVITATQMLESMITQPMATRAETNDVANAVWDGTDAVMLSAETAVGKHPIEAVQTMHRIILAVEERGPVRTPASEKPLPTGKDVTLKFADAIARAAHALSETAPAEHIVVFTQTGTAVKRVAKYRPNPPIIAVAESEEYARRLNMVWGVRAVVVPVVEDPDTMFRIAGNAIVEAGLAKQDEYALLVGSLPMTHIAGRTNLLHVRKLGT